MTAKSKKRPRPMPSASVPARKAKLRTTNVQTRATTPTVLVAIEAPSPRASHSRFAAIAIGASIAAHVVFLGFASTRRMPPPSPSDFVTVDAIDVAIAEPSAPPLPSAPIEQEPAPKAMAAPEAPRAAVASSPAPESKPSPAAPAPPPVAAAAAAAAPAEAKFALSTEAFAAAPLATTAGAGAQPTATSAGLGAPTTGGSGHGDETFGEAQVGAPARLRSSVAVVYPEPARDAAIEADVPVSIVVDASGQVVDARAAGHAGYGLDEAAVAAVRRYRFSPAMREGSAVRVRMRWNVQFRLR